MQSKAYKQFLDSMVMDFNKWHDGIGYDLKTLKQLEPDEQSSVEELLIKNLKEAGDWRDVEALVAIPTATACKAVDEALFHNKSKVRHYALWIALNNWDSKEATKEEMTVLEDHVIRAVKHGYYEIAEKMPTTRVKKALLDSTIDVNNEYRGSAAAFLLYLCGGAPEPYDWSQRPFFLLFAEKDPKMLHLAWQHLRKRTGL